jgi:hypothetical protein
LQYFILSASYELLDLKRYFYANWMGVLYKFGAKRNKINNFERLLSINQLKERKTVADIQTQFTQEMKDRKLSL